MRAEQQPQVDKWLAQCNPMTASGSFLQVSGLQLQAGVGGREIRERDTGFTGRLHSRNPTAPSMRLCCHGRT